MKKYDYPYRVAAMRMLSAGNSISRVEKLTGIDHSILRLLWRRYSSYGELALLEEGQRRRTYEEKLGMMHDLVDKKLSLKEVSLKYDICVSSLMRWRRAYIERGSDGLKSKKGEVARKKQRTEAELDELEMLRKRNEYLEAENALLKKVKALVEEREARLRAIGRKPSKD